MIKHGQCKRGKITAERRLWANMKNRCHYPKHDHYYLYGARGITVCDEWKNSFITFFEDMGKKPSNLHSLERLDNSKGYSKENCIWATSHEQARNRRNNNWLEHEGRKMIIEDWARELGVRAQTINHHLKTRSFSFIYNYYDYKKKNNITSKFFQIKTYAKISNSIHQQQS